MATMMPAHHRRGGRRRLGQFCDMRLMAVSIGKNVISLFAVFRGSADVFAVVFVMPYPATHANVWRWAMAKARAVRIWMLRKRLRANTSRSPETIAPALPATAASKTRLSNGSASTARMRSVGTERCSGRWIRRGDLSSRIADTVASVSSVFGEINYRQDRDEIPSRGFG